MPDALEAFVIEVLIEQDNNGVLFYDLMVDRAQTKTALDSSSAAPVSKRSQNNYSWHSDNLILVPAKKQVNADACRNCYGEGFQRQRTVGKMNRDREKHAAKGSIDDFDEEGGIGFDPLRPPHKDCPGCGGDGHALAAELRL